MKNGLLVAGLAGALLAQGCAMRAAAPTDNAPQANVTPRAAATLAQIGASGVAGTVSFTPVSGGLRVAANVTGLQPGSEHGFHVHEVGNCASPDGMSAGGHFNPGGKPHGHPASHERHAGDMVNLKADAQGVARVSFVVPGLTVGDGAASVIGRAVVVHRNPDDYSSQPAGNAGARIACGVIRGA